MFLQTSKKIDADRVFVIGDIHGCFEHLQFMYAFLSNEIKVTDKDVILFLGDYIDRGPKQVSTLDFLCKIKEERPNTIFLKGNHEDMFLDFIGLSGQYGNMSCYNGSFKLFEEYGLAEFIHSNYDGESRWVDITKEEVRQRIPKHHLDFILNLDMSAETDNVIFVHAGINPYRDAENQTNEDLLWIREDFTNWIERRPIDKLIIHGHTIVKNGPVYDLPYYINIDTGCFKNGILSCLQVNPTNLKEFVEYKLNNMGELTEEQIHFENTIS